MERLSLILWRERELLETLLFKLEQEQMILAGGNARWLARSAREVETVVGLIRETELMRAVAADEAAAAIGLASNPSLRALADAVDEPWRSILGEHRDAFVAYTAEILELASANRELLTTGYLAARDTLLALGETTRSYSADGSVVTAPLHTTRLLDRSI